MQETLVTQVEQLYGTKGYRVVGEPPQDSGNELSALINSIDKAYEVPLPTEHLGQEAVRSALQKNRRSAYEIMKDIIIPSTGLASISYLIDDFSNEPNAVAALISGAVVGGILGTGYVVLRAFNSPIKHEVEKWAKYGKRHDCLGNEIELTPLYAYAALHARAKTIDDAINDGLIL